MPFALLCHLWEVFRGETPSSKVSLVADQIASLETTDVLHRGLEDAVCLYVAHKRPRDQQARRRGKQFSLDNDVVERHARHCAFGTVAHNHDVIALRLDGPDILKRDVAD